MRQTVQKMADLSAVYFLVCLLALLAGVANGQCDWSGHREIFSNVTCYGSNGEVISPDSSSVLLTGSTCRVICLVDGSERDLLCDEETWFTSPTQCGAPLRRRKRFWGFIVAAVVGLIFSGGRKGPPADRSPPRVFCPPDIHRLADPIQTSTRISWDESVAYAVDDRDGRITARRSSRKGPYYVFWGTTIIKYYARDKSGNNGYCAMTITVQTVRCSPGPNRGFKNGYYTCHPSVDFVYGTQCNYGCYYGYKIAGNKHRECLKDGQWSSGEPRCEVATCPPIEPFPDGTFTCNDNFNFKSACTYTCKPGYDVTPGTSRVRVCGHDGRWRGAIPTCIDAEAPVFIDCPGVLSYWTTRGSSQALVEWNTPAVSDNSDVSVDPTQTSGIANNEFHPAGVYDVEYGARDAVGNEARPCNFKVVVKELKCLAQYPLPYMKVDCPEGYRHGARCEFTCDDGYAMNGSNSVTCERSDTSPPYAYWRMNQQPSCSVESTCPTLTPPDNGALACDLWESGEFCQMQCMMGTDIPPEFDAWKLFVCNRNGIWKTTRLEPFDGNIPQCSKTQNPSHTVMTASVYYFDGACSESDVMTEIKENFLQAMQQSPFNSNLDPALLTVEYVKVYCGAVIEKRSTDSHKTVLELTIIANLGTGDIKLAFKEAERKTKEFIELIEDDVTSDTSKLLANLGPATRDRVGVNSTRVEFDCPSGSLPSYGTWSCAQCTAGTFFESGRCVSCSEGFYQEQQGQTECTRCPHATTTLRTGATTPQHCLSQCSLGHFSANGVKPCTPCDVGEYTDSLGERGCKTCPVSMTTERQGSTGISACKHFDITLPDATLSMAEFNIMEDLDLSQGFSVSLWVMSSFGTGGGVFSLSSVGSVTSLISLGVNSQQHLTLNTPSTSNVLEVSTDVGRWHHVQLSYESELTVHVNGDNVYQDSITETTWSGATKPQLKLGGGGFTGSVSQVNIWRKPVDIAPVSSPQCFSSDTGDIVAWISFTTANMTEAFIQTPSQCDDTNECLSNPCEHGNCTDILHGFTCTCQSGYKGDNCQVNVDDCLDNMCSTGSTCMDGVNGYTCACLPEYTGEFCDAQLVHGKWGEWGNWSQCSTTCGAGENTRTRRCDSPVPQNGGNECSGSAQEIGKCNDTACLKCPDRVDPVHGRLECEQEIGMTRCQLMCDSGYDADLEPLSAYECGEETGFAWNYITEDNPNGRLPNCMQIQGPSEMEMSFPGEYMDLPCRTSDSHLIRDLAQQHVNNLPCFKNDQCYLKNVIVNENCDGSRQKREVTLANFVIVLATDSSTNGLEESLNNLQSALNQLNSSALAGTFTVTIGGKEYHIFPSFNVSGEVTCPSGHASVKFYCVPCGPGTYYTGGGYCERCAIGTYSNSSMASTCRTCPAGYITPGTASISLDECTVPVDLPQDTSRLLVATLTPVLAIAAVMTAIIIYIRIKGHTHVSHKKKKLRNSNIKEAWLPNPTDGVFATTLPLKLSVPDMIFSAHSTTTDVMPLSKVKYLSKLKPIDVKNLETNLDLETPETSTAGDQSEQETDSTEA